MLFLAPLKLSFCRCVQRKIFPWHRHTRGEKEGGGELKSARFKSFSDYSSGILQTPDPKYNTIAENQGVIAKSRFNRQIFIQLCWTD